jgi:hypothetical protein
VQLAFPPFVAATEGPLGAALLRGLCIIFVMCLMHMLYAIFRGSELVESVQRIEDLLVLAIFSGFQFILLWMPERSDLQAAAFALWLLLFCVRSALRGVISSLS